MDHKFRMALFWFVACLPVCAEDYYPPPDSAGGWRTLTDSASIRKTAGIDSHKLDLAFEYAKRTSPHGGLLVVRHGYLVYERYFGRGNRAANPSMASVGKAYTSIACGIMLEEKRDQIPLGQEQKVFTEKYLPQAFPLSDPSKAEIKLGNLLTMTSGMQDGTAGFVNHGLQQLKPTTRRDTALDQDQAAAAYSHVVRAGWRLFVLIAIDSRCFHRPAPPGGDGAAGLRE